MKPDASRTTQKIFAGRPISVVAGALAGLAVVTAACTTSYAPPDLGSLYDRTAQHHGPARNPIIVIPGLTGSVLVDDSSGRTVWGAFAGDYADPSTPEGARLVALPMTEGVPLDQLRDSVRPDGVLEQLRLRLLGIPLQVRAYVQILAALGAGGYRDQSLGIAGAIDYGSDHYTCFQFAYDWRRDLVENARRFEQFVDETREYVRQQTLERYGTAPEVIRFDVAAHSMGSLLVRYFLRYGSADPPDPEAGTAVPWTGADDLERIVLVGPPNAGTVDALLQLVEGRDYGPFIPSYPPAVLATFPSGYQLLPRARHGSVVVEGTGDPVDPFDPEVWERMGWGLADPAQAHVLARLLPSATPEERQRIALDHLRKSLRRARSVTAALDRPAGPPPEHLRMFLVAGDAVETERRVAVEPGTGALRVTARAPGDGTVLRSSALLDERLTGDWQPALRSPIPWTDVLFLFNDHLGLTRDPTFTDNLLYWLLEDPRERHQPVG